MNINEKDKILKEAIVETIAFFDMFNFPLTETEILKYIKIKSDYLEVRKELMNLIRDKVVCSCEGLYFLVGADLNIEARKENYNHSDRKFKLALKVSKYFLIIPWIKLICVANNIGTDNLKNSGDIDLFIVSKSKKIWLTRLFVVLIAKIMNVRPQKNNKTDKICLSFFISEDSLDLSELRQGGEADKYLEYWLLGLNPIYSKDNTFEMLFKANRKIIDNFPNYYEQKISSKRKMNKQISGFYELNWELFFGKLESLVKNIQIKIMPAELKSIASQGVGVILGDNVIKLHLNDKREEFRKKYNEKISKIKN